jgi:hypothetical protein
MKKILVIGPILPYWEEIQHITETLKFLSVDNKIDFIDPLIGLTMCTNRTQFFEKWYKRLKKLIFKYDIFLGFSLGGIVLQELMNKFEFYNKRLIFFSTPSFIDNFLYERLGKIIELTQKELVLEAINFLNQYVFYPFEPPAQNSQIINLKFAALRLQKGLQFVLETDIRHILEKIQLPFIHFIGEKSELVNKDHITHSLTGQIIIVPNAGMRVLQNNLPYCTKPIIQFLQD